MARTDPDDTNAARATRARAYADSHRQLAAQLRAATPSADAAPGFHAAAKQHESNAAWWDRYAAELDRRMGVARSCAAEAPPSATQEA